MAEITAPSQPTSTTELIVARFRWTADELRTALRSHYRYSSTRLARFTLISTCAIAVLVSLVMFWTQDVPDGFAIIPLFFGILLFCAWASRSLTVSQSWARRQFRNRPDQDLEIEWRFGPDELRTRSKLFETRFAWPAFVKVVETPGGLLLYNLTNYFQWLPRHAFSSDTEFEQVVAWAEQNVPVYRRGERSPSGQLADHL